MAELIEAGHGHAGRGGRRIRSSTRPKRSASSNGVTRAEDRRHRLTTAVVRAWRSGRCWAAATRRQAVRRARPRPGLLVSGRRRDRLRVRLGRSAAGPVVDPNERCSRSARSPSPSPPPPGDRGRAGEVGLDDPVVEHLPRGSACRCSTTGRSPSPTWPPTPPGSETPAEVPPAGAPSPRASYANLSTPDVLDALGRTRPRALAGGGSATRTTARAYSDRAHTRPAWTTNPWSARITSPLRLNDTIDPERRAAGQARSRDEVARRAGRPLDDPGAGGAEALRSTAADRSGMSAPRWERSRRSPTSWRPRCVPRTPSERGPAASPRDAGARLVPSGDRPPQALGRDDDGGTAATGAWSAGPVGWSRVVRCPRTSAAWTDRVTAGARPRDRQGERRSPRRRASPRRASRSPRGRAAAPPSRSGSPSRPSR